MNRRGFITLLGGAAAWPLAVRAQQAKSLHLGIVAFTPRTAPHWGGFEQRLRELGHVDGQNDRLPAMVAELASRKVAVLVASGGVHTALAAKTVSATIPVVFANGSDPLRFGLVASLNRPGGNITGVSFFTATLEAKRLGLLSQLVPAATSFAALINPGNANAEIQREDIQQGGRVLGRPLTVVKADDANENAAAFETLAQRRIGALLVASDPFFFSRRDQIVALAARHRLPALYEWREFAQAGGLASYGTNLVDAHRFAGIYAGRILKGEKASDLPVVQASKFEFVLNLRIARALGIEVSLGLSAAADEIIE